MRLFGKASKHEENPQTTSSAAPAQGANEAVEPAPAPPQAAASRVRTAEVADAPAMAKIQSATMIETLQAALGHSLDAEITESLAPQALAATWHDAVAMEPEPFQRVVVADAGGEVVGLAFYSPAPRLALGAEDAPVVEGLDVNGQEITGTPLQELPPDAAAGAEASAEKTAEKSAPGMELLDRPAQAEIGALEVSPAHRRQGHGSRLLAACVDLLREAGATRVQTWIVDGDEARTRFFASAGFAPAGIRRHLEVGADALTEICWYSDI